MINNKGTVTFIVLIISLLILGSIAVVAISGFGVGQNLFTRQDSKESVGPQVPTDSKIDALNSQSESDEVDLIEKDLNSTQLDSLDSEVDQVDQDMKSL